MFLSYEKPRKEIARVVPSSLFERAHLLKEDIKIEKSFFMPHQPTMNKEHTFFSRATTQSRNNEKGATDIAVELGDRMGTIATVVAVLIALNTLSATVFEGWSIPIGIQMTQMQLLINNGSWVEMFMNNPMTAAYWAKTALHFGAVGVGAATMFGMVFDIFTGMAGDIKTKKNHGK